VPAYAGAVPFTVIVSPSGEPAGTEAAATFPLTVGTTWTTSAVAVAFTDVRGARPIVRWAA
jgi:hypothetical protein